MLAFEALAQRKNEDKVFMKSVGVECVCGGRQDQMRRALL